jgi:hypothetical protein
MDGLEQTRALDSSVAELADAQYGVVARRQLLMLGVGAEAIEVRLRTSRLHRLYRGVYAVGHRVQSRESDRDRDRRLAVAGYRSTRVTWRQLLDIPEEIAVDLKKLLEGEYNRP